MTADDQRIVMDVEEIDAALEALADHIVQKNAGLADVALVGIADGGVPIYRRLQNLLKTKGNLLDELPSGIIDITLYRDDLTINDQPELKDMRLDFDVNGKTIILVDDVVFTGRTVRSAIMAVMDYGRPGKIQLAALVDRGHRELPIQPDFVGKVIQTAADELVEVYVSATQTDTDRVVVRPRPVS